MYIQKLPYIIYRAYPSYGYLTDNRNFGYDTASKSCLKVGDLILSQEGSAFYSVLEYRLLSIDEIVCRLVDIYKDVSLDILTNDALSFYCELSNKGFLLCVENAIVENQQPVYFSYENVKPFNLDVVQSCSFTYDNIFGTHYTLSRVQIDVSSLCNENCIHCYIPKRNKCAIMTEDMFDKVLDQCKEMRVLNVTLSGGEPMLNPYFKSFLVKCRECNFSINILSNLTYLTDELLEEIISNPLISIQTSLYAMDEKVHDAITQNKGSYCKTIKGIRKLYTHNVPLQINCPIMKQNVHYYRDVLTFAASLNIEATSDYVLFGSYDASNANIECRISASKVSEILKKNYMDECVLNEEVQISNQKEVKDDDYICSICKSSLCVSNNGDVYPCEGWQRMILGNINLHTLKCIWEDMPITQALRELKYKDFEPCNTCQIRKYCNTCLIMNANENIDNDYMIVNPYMCKLANIKEASVKFAKKV